MTAYHIQFSETDAGARCSFGSEVYCTNVMNRNLAIEGLAIDGAYTYDRLSEAGFVGYNTCQLLAVDLIWYFADPSTVCFQSQNQAGKSDIVELEHDVIRICI